MEQREALAKLIAATLIDIAGAAGEGGPVQEDLLLADVLLQDGWTKLRTIDTTEELDVLPEGTEIVDQHERLTLDEDPDGDLWWYDQHGNTCVVALPAFVVPPASAL